MTVAEVCTGAGSESETVTPATSDRDQHVNVGDRDRDSRLETLSDSPIFFREFFKKYQ